MRAATVTGSLCRQIASRGPCDAVDTSETRVALPVPSSGQTGAVVWTDSVPASLATGVPRPMNYRVELRNPAGKSAGPSDPAYTAAGAAPPPVTQLQAEGTRVGVALRWTPAPHQGEVLLRRVLAPAVATDTTAGNPMTSTRAGTGGAATENFEEPGNGKAAKKAKGPKSLKDLRGHGGESRTESHTRGAVPGVVVLQAAPGVSDASATVDREVTEGSTYRYTAYRREIVQVGGRTLELQSAPGAEVTVTWRDTYPPEAPAGLAALGYHATSRVQTTGNEPPGVFAVDLVWQPVDDSRLAGYLVYRQALDVGRQVRGERMRLTPEPLPTPGFHDASALPGQAYRYGVTAIDPKGNESRPVEAVVEATGGYAH